MYCSKDKILQELYICMVYNYKIQSVPEERYLNHFSNFPTFSDPKVFCIKSSV